MKHHIFNYLNNTIKPVGDGFVKCKKSASDDEEYQFVCGGIRGLISFKFKGLSPEQIAEFHMEYIKEYRLLGFAKKQNFFTRIFGKSK